MGILVSKQTLHNWLIDATLFFGGVVTALTSIYFLFLPVGGYQGGRNPYYGITILFDRHAWDDLHTWFGLAMIAAAAIHFTLHWNWVKSTARRTAKSLAGKGSRMNRRGALNVLVDATIALGFGAGRASGIFFFLMPAKGAAFILSGAAWDLLHTWAGVAMIVAAVIHIAIHGTWVTKVMAKILVTPRIPIFTH